MSNDLHLDHVNININGNWMLWACWPQRHNFPLNFEICKVWTSPKENQPSFQGIGPSPEVRPCQVLRAPASFSGVSCTTALDASWCLSLLLWVWGSEQLSSPLRLFRWGSNCPFSFRVRQSTVSYLTSKDFVQTLSNQSNWKPQIESSNSFPSLFWGVISTPIQLEDFLRTAQRKLK